MTLVGDEDPVRSTVRIFQRTILPVRLPKIGFRSAAREYYESIHVEMVTGDPAVRIDRAPVRLLCEWTRIAVRRAFAGPWSRSPVAFHRRRRTAARPALTNLG